MHIYCLVEVNETAQTSGTNCQYTHVCVYIYFDYWTYIHQLLYIFRLLDIHLSTITITIFYVCVCVCIYIQYIYFDYWTCIYQLLLLLYFVCVCVCMKSAIPKGKDEIWAKPTLKYCVIRLWEKSRGARREVEQALITSVSRVTINPAMLCNHYSIPDSGYLNTAIENDF
jgi:hypothetical protein